MGTFSKTSTYSNYQNQDLNNYNILIDSIEFDENLLIFHINKSRNSIFMILNDCCLSLEDINENNLEYKEDFLEKFLIEIQDLLKDQVNLRKAVTHREIEFLGVVKKLNPSVLKIIQFFAILMTSMYYLAHLQSPNVKKSLEIESSIDANDLDKLRELCSQISCYISIFETEVPDSDKFKSFITKLKKLKNLIAECVIHRRQIFQAEDRLDKMYFGL